MLAAPAHLQVTVETGLRSAAIAPAWTYWSGTRGEPPPVIQLCFQTQKRQHPGWQVIDDRWIREHGGQGLLELGSRHIISAQADLVRFWLLANWGGLWLDSDCLCLKSCSLPNLLTGTPYQKVPGQVPGPDLAITDVADGYHMACPRGNTGRCFSHAIAAVAGSPIAVEGLKRCKIFLERHSRGFAWADSADGVLESLLQYFPGPGRMALGCYDRAPCGAEEDSRTYKLERTDAEHAPRGIPGQLELYHLCQRIYQPTSRWSRQKLLDDRGWLGCLFRRGLGLPPRNDPCPHPAPPDLPPTPAQDLAAAAKVAMVAQHCCGMRA